LIYRVWTKGEYEGWVCQECETLVIALGALKEALLSGKNPILTTDVPYNFRVDIVKIGEPEHDDEYRSTKPDGWRMNKEGTIEGGGFRQVKEDFKAGIKKEDKVEVTKGKTKLDKGSGGESDGEIHAGNEAVTDGLD